MPNYLYFDHASRLPNHTLPSKCPTTVAGAWDYIKSAFSAWDNFTQGYARGLGPPGWDTPRIFMGMEVPANLSAYPNCGDYCGAKAKVNSDFMSLANSFNTNILHNDFSRFTLDNVDFRTLMYNAENLARIMNILKEIVREAQSDDCPISRARKLRSDYYDLLANHSLWPTYFVDYDDNPAKYGVEEYVKGPCVCGDNCPCGDDDDPGFGNGGAYPSLILPSDPDPNMARPYNIPASPIILDLNGDGVRTIGVEDGVHFDHDGNRFAEKTGWVSAEDALLVWDKNRNGLIDDGSELFGNNYTLKDGSKAANGFEALKEFDSNGDGVVDARDDRWGELQLWQDRNGNYGDTIPILREEQWN